LESRWEMLKFPPSANRRQGRIAQRLLAKMGKFPSLFSEALHFCYYLLKSNKQCKILQTLSGSSPIFELSIYTTFGQTQTGATVPSNTASEKTQCSELLQLCYRG
jgi:hypothetical protein